MISLSVFNEDEAAYDEEPTEHNWFGFNLRLVSQHQISHTEVTLSLGKNLSWIAQISTLMSRSSIFANLQWRLFSVCLTISLDSITSRLLLLQIKRQESRGAALKKTGPRSRNGLKL